MLYFQLFISFLKTGFLGFGGGMAILSLIQHEVLRYGWMTETEFADIVAISQVTPGPIGINCATYVGYTVTGSVWGSVVATFAVVLPSLIIMLALCAIYARAKARWSQNRIYKICMRVIRVLVVLLIAHAAYSLMTPAMFIDWKSWTIFGITLGFMLTPMIAKNKVTDILSHPILLICMTGLAGFLIYKL